MTDESFAGSVDAPAEHSGAPIDVDAPSTPHALGSQIPPQAEKPEPEADKAPKSAGEAIRRANEALKAKEAAAKAEPKEPVKVEAKPDAKPAEPVKAPAPRSEDGKFASAKPVEQQAPQAAKPVEPNSPHRDAPARFDEAAKAEWEKAPESIKGAVHRTIRELEQGHQKYKADSERFDKIREYDDLARQNGREGVHESLKQVVEIERAFQRNPIEGFQKIADHFGIPLRSVAAHIMGQTPDQVQGQQDSTIASLKQELATLKQQLGGVTQTLEQQRTTATISQVEAFAKDHPRFDELSEDIAFFLNSGRTKDLAEAYELAERLNPAPASASSNGAHTPTPTPLAQTQASQPNPAGQKSISGAPATGSDPTSRKSGPVPSIRESLNRAKRNLG